MPKLKIKFTFLKFSTVSGLKARQMPITNVQRPLTISSISSFSRRFAYTYQGMLHNIKYVEYIFVQSQCT